MARRSDRDAEFSAFMDAARASLGRTAWFLTGDRDAAAELLQATLVKTYVAWPRVRPDGALAYARRIMVNTDLDRHRARRFSVPVADPPEQAVEDATAGVTSSNGSARCWPHCRRNSVGSSCCGTCTTSPRPTWPRNSACRWARSSRTPPVGWPHCGRP